MHSSQLLAVLALVVMVLCLVTGLAICGTITFYNYVEAQHELQRKQLAEDSLAVMQKGMKEGFESVSNKIPTIPKPFQKAFSKRQDKNEQNSTLFGRGTVLGR